MRLVFLLIVKILRVSSCPLTENFLAECHCGILTSGESYISCRENSVRSVPSFKKSFPYDELRLAKNFIENLTKNSFENLRTIKRINLDENRLKSIDDEVLKQMGNYLEELTLTGDGKIESLEFLTRFPLKKLRFLKLSRFNLSRTNLKETFSNLTKLDRLVLDRCQIREIPQLEKIVDFDLSENNLTENLFLSTSFTRLNLANNRISSIILQRNPSLIELNLSANRLKEIYSLNKNRLNLKKIDLSKNFLTFVDRSTLPKSLVELNINENLLTKIDFDVLPSSLVELSAAKNSLVEIKFSKNFSALKSIDFSSNRIQKIEKNSFLQRLEMLKLDDNPLHCDCQLGWLKTLGEKRFNVSTWHCETPRRQLFSASKFQCSKVEPARISNFNVTLVRWKNQFGFFLQWKIVDEHRTLKFIQIQLEPNFLSSKQISADRTSIFLFDQIEFDRFYRLCLIVGHKFGRDRYCRKIFTDSSRFQSVEIFPQENFLELSNEENGENLRLLIVASSLGLLLTLLLLLIFCYLCYQIGSRNNESRRRTTKKQIYDLSSSSLPTENNKQNKHIYQTIDNRDYCSLTRSDKHLLDSSNALLRDN